MTLGRTELSAALYSLAGAGASFGFSVLVARALGVAERGEFLAMQLPVTLLLPLAVVGTGQAAVYHIAARPEHARSYAKSALVVATVASCIVALIGSIVAATIARDPVWAALFWYIPPFAVLGVIANLYRAHGLFTVWSRMRVGALVVPVVGLPVLWAGGVHGMTLVVASMVVPTAIAAGVGAWRVRLLATGGTVSTEIVGRLVRYGLPGMMAMLLNGVSRRADQLVLAAILIGSPELGYYAVAASYSAVAFALAVSIGQPTAVAVARLDPGERPARARQVVRKAAAPLLCGSALAAVGAFVLIEPVFGDRYAAAVVPAAVLTVAAGIYAIGAVASEMLRAMGRPGDVVIGEIVGLVGQVVLFVVLVPRYSIIGAALSSLGGYCLATITLLGLLRAERSPAPVAGSTLEPAA